MDSEIIYIDIDQLVRKYGVTKATIASTLYDDNEYPGQALGRIMKLGCDIKASQIIALAELLGCRPGDVFAAPAGAYKHITEGETGLHVFTRDNVRITLDTDTGTTLIYLEETNVMQTVIHDTAIAMDEYLEQIDLLIADFLASPVGAEA